MYFFNIYAFILKIEHLFINYPYHNKYCRDKRI